MINVLEETIIVELFIPVSIYPIAFATKLLYYIQGTQQKLN